MNPFDWRGPEFLAFFAGCIAIVLFAISRVLHALESSDPVRVDVSDPYQLAFLRVGAVAAVEVALVALIDRGILAVVRPEASNDGTGIVRAVTRLARFRARGRPRVVQAAPRAETMLHHPLEKAVCAHFAAPGRLVDTSLRSLTRAARAHCELPLQELGLLASPATRRRRALLAVVGTALLWSIAGTKISIALSRGHTNIGLLVLLAVVATVMCFAFVPARTTIAGRQMVESLRGLFRRLPERAGQIQPGGATNELPVLAALFGLSAVPQSIFPHRDAVVRRVTSMGSGGSCSAVASCGTAASCGAGSASCGGGGGGGGCGGCGS